MALMGLYRLTPRARRDLAQIWRYLVPHWGEQQATTYIGQIRTAIEAIAENPGLSRPCDDIRKGYRKYPSGAHVLFLRQAEDAIEIVRILHERMDFKRRL